MMESATDGNGEACTWIIRNSTLLAPLAPLRPIGIRAIKATSRQSTADLAAVISVKVVDPAPRSRRQEQTTIRQSDTHSFIESGCRAHLPVVTVSLDGLKTDAAEKPVINRR